MLMTNTSSGPFRNKALPNRPVPRYSPITMRTLTVLLTLLCLGVCAFGQGNDLPTFTVTTNDVEQSSIGIWPKGDKVTVKFAFTDSGAKRLEKFYRAQGFGEKVRYQIGRFEWPFRIDDRKHFGREGFW